MMLLGLMLSLVISTDPRAQDIVATIGTDAQSRVVGEIVQTESGPGTTTVAVAVSSGAASGASASTGAMLSPVSGFGSPPDVSRDRWLSPRTAAPAHSTAVALTTGSELPNSGSSSPGSLLTRVGASLAAVVSGLTPSLPPMEPISMVRRVAVPADGSGGFGGNTSGPGFAVLIFAAGISRHFLVRRFIDDRARLTWAFVAPLQRPG
ncbi:MAG TPA: hypothetical protein VFE65_14150 [Pseudonocardia sp.]|nr:hypothetical protein [Pseudonocardia sp.]